MIARALILILLLASACTRLPAQSQTALRNQTRLTLDRALPWFHGISTNGGYVGIYSSDLNKRYGEALYEPARPSEIWVQPPGTPSVGLTFLRAWRLTNDPEHLKAAVDAARALAWGQRRIGGWDHRVDVAHLDQAALTVTRNGGACTFDDAITQGALQFLIEIDHDVDAPWLTETIELGLDFVMKSQFENGAWPQWYPLRGGYHDHYTFNDNAINDCIALMTQACQAYGDDRYLRTAKRGGDFIILSQINAPQSGWAQQYSHDLQPAWARRFEPPGVCSAVTARNIVTLIDLARATGDAKYLEPIPAAVRWLQASKIGEDLWARLYEVGSNRPIYGDRMNGGKIHYDYDRISEKERTSYAWQNDYGIPEIITRAREIQDLGAEAWLARSDDQSDDRTATRQVDELERQVRDVIQRLDDQGRWIADDGMLYSRDFVRNAGLLCDYLALDAPPDTQR